MNSREQRMQATKEDKEEDAKRGESYDDDDALKLKRCWSSHRNRHNKNEHTELNDRGAYRQSRGKLDAQFSV